MAVYSGGVPMVKIDGAAVRRLREERSLTQLYLASAVEVTTDTISRWENKRYPQIKKENALKLAEALAVDLEEILDDHDEDERTAKSEPEPLSEAPPEEEKRVPLSAKGEPGAGLTSFSPRARAFWAIFFLIIVLGALYFFREPVSHSQPMSALRIAPDHIVVGDSFPVVISIDMAGDASSFILRETIPDNCQLVEGHSSGAIVDPKSNEIKWIIKPSTHLTRVGYMLLLPENKSREKQVNYAGSITQRRANGKGTDVGGKVQSIVSISHWADVNQDGVIDDEEILTVYDDYDEIEGVVLDMEEIEDIWFGSGYQWDSSTKKFVILN